MNPCPADPPVPLPPAPPPPADDVEASLYEKRQKIYPQDFLYLALLLILAALALFFFTSLAGRLWCGYACPQTVYTEVFLWIERKIEGDRPRQMKLDRAPWSTRAALPPCSPSSRGRSRCGSRPSSTSSATATRSTARRATGSFATSTR